MNQSIAVHNLNLPKDLIDLICSFNFYSLSDCIEMTSQQKRKLCSYIETIKYTVMYFPGSTTMLTYNKYNNLQYQYNICNVCHNYIVSSSIMLHHNALCFCSIPDRIIVKMLHNLYITFYI